MRIALLGGESSGKSTLAAALAERFDTLWVHEYGRELTEARGGQLVFEDLLAIGEVQVARELDALPRARRFLFCDTTPLVTAYYSQAMFGRVDPHLEALATRAYHHTFLCAPDFDFVQDGLRQDARFRQHQHDSYRDALAASGASYSLIGGSLDDRIAAATGILLRL